MNLKIKFLPYEKFKVMDLDLIMRDLRDGTIILVDAKLNPEEEAVVIEETMKKVSDKFSGIELGSIDLSEKETGSLKRIKNNIIERIIGRKRGMTIIGPAKVIHKVQKNPEELLLYM